MPCDKGCPSKVQLFSVGFHTNLLFYVQTFVLRIKFGGYIKVYFGACLIIRNMFDGATNAIKFGVFRVKFNGFAKIGNGSGEVLEINFSHAANAVGF